MNKMMLKKQYMLYSPKKSTSRLPSDFQEVEYIQGTGTQYINTLVIPTSKTGWEIEFEQEKTDVWYFGVDTGWETNGFGFNVHKKYATTDIYPLLYINSGILLENFETLEANQRYVAKYGNGLFRVNSTEYSVPSFTGNLTIPIYTHCINRNNIAGDTTQGTGKIYSLKFYEDNTIIRDFIPCYRKSDNEVGLYDIVNNQFYTNSGSGSFLKGKDVIYTSTNAVSFATDSWSTIQAEAERISNFYEEYGFIPFNTPYAIYNPENNDTKNIRTITYNNEEIQIAIIGMCHDTLQTPYSGGGTKAGITWQTTNILFKSAVNSSSSSGGWSSCSLRASLNSTHFNSLSQEMQNAIKVVAKKSNNGSGSITTTNDKLFTLSMVEIMGTTKRNSSTNFAIEGEGTQYEYYKNAPLIIDSKNITWTGLSGTKGTCIANGNSYMTLIDGVQTPDANDYVNYRNAKEYKLDGNESYYSTRSFRDSYNECMFIWITGIVSYSSATNSKLGVVFAGCI